ncbi:MAG: hypothetical protein LBL54_02515, partial [Clostridiales Family XIII bacterium]|nr:hypothetical protein [Clostridiales Family XIII bacterium]
MSSKTIKGISPKPLLTIILCVTTALTFILPAGGGPAYEVYAAQPAEAIESAPRVTAFAAKAKLPKGRYVVRPLGSDTRVLTVKGASKKNNANIYL